MSKATIKTLSYLEALELLSTVNFQLNVGRVSEDYTDKKMAKLCQSLQEHGGNLQPIEIATTLNGELGILSGNFRGMAILNAKRINDDKETKTIKDISLDLSECTFEFMDYGEVNELDWRARCDLHGTQVGLTKLGVFSQVEALVYLGITSESKIMARLGYSKGKIQEHLKVCVMENEVNGMKDAWLGNTVNRAQVNDLYSTYNAYTENGEQLTTEAEQDIAFKFTEAKADDTPTPSMMQRKEVAKLLKTSNALYKPMLELVLGIRVELPSGYQTSDYILENAQDND